MEIEEGQIWKYVESEIAVYIEDVKKSYVQYLGFFIDGLHSFEASKVLFEEKFEFLFDVKQSNMIIGKISEVLSGD